MKNQAETSSFMALNFTWPPHRDVLEAAESRPKKPGIIPLSGMDNHQTGTPGTGGMYSIPASPDVYCTAGDRPGEIDLQWDPVAGATTYLIEVSPERPVNWRSLGNTRQSKFTTQGLVSGTLYWFRVYAVNLAGKSKWSVPVMKIVP